MKFIVAHCNITRASWDTEQQKLNCRKNEHGKILSHWHHFFGCNFSPYVFFRNLFRQPPPSFPEWRAFRMASNICSCRTPSSSPLSDSSLIQTIIDATILEVLRPRNIFPNFENAWIIIVKLDGGLFISPLPSRLISLAQELRLYGERMLSLHNLSLFLITQECCEV